MRARLVAIGVLLAAPAEAKMVCMSRPMAPRVVQFDAQVPGSGGVIVASGGGLPDWRFRRVNTVVRADIELVAPGLAIFHPPATVGPELFLEDTNHALQLTGHRLLTVTQERLAPPKLAEVVLTRLSPTYVRVTGRVSVAVPASAIVVVVYAVGGSKVTPLAWARLAPGETALDLFHSRGGCEEYIPQAIEPAPGQHIAIAWLDAGGRLSDRSNVVEVPRTAAKAPR